MKSAKKTKAKKSKKVRSKKQKKASGALEKKSTRNSQFGSLVRVVPISSLVGIGALFGSLRTLAGPCY